LRTGRLVCGRSWPRSAGPSCLTPSTRGRLWGSALRAAGHICRSAPVVLCYSRSHPVARVAHGSSGRRGPPRTPVVDKCRVGPGESRWWLVRIAAGGWLAPAVCHSSVSALPPALVWWYGSASTTISSIGSRRVPRHLTPFGIGGGWGVALMGNVVRGSSTMRTTWRTGWIPEPLVLRRQQQRTVQEALARGSARTGAQGNTGG
jgi:hypothetical protein